MPRDDRARCGHLVAKNRSVHEYGCWDCTARTNAAIIDGRRNGKTTIQGDLPIWKPRPLRFGRRQ